MYTMMLVDDEPEVLDSMIDTIDWNSYGFEVPVACRDGNEAIEKIEAGFVPQALVTDIRMPCVDGLELTAFVRERFPDVPVVILSGHDEFSYAQKAIQMQAYNYILKPVTPAKLGDILNEIRKELGERKGSGAEQTIDIIKTDFLNRLIARPLETSIIKEHAKHCRIDFFGKYHAVAVMDVNAGRDFAETNERQEMSLLRFGLHNVACELSAQQSGIIIFQSKERTKIISSGANKNEAEIKAAAAAKEIAILLEANMDISVSCGVGRAVASLQELYQSDAEASEALGLTFYFENGSIIKFSDITAALGGLFQFSKHEKAFEIAVQHFDSAGALHAVDGMFREMRETFLPAESCVKYCQRLAVYLIRFIGEFSQDQKVKHIEAEWEKQNLHTAATLGQMQGKMKHFCAQAFTLLDVVCNDSTSGQVARAEMFIKQNYANPRLSLQVVTEHLAVSTSYFSTIFKNGTGMTFVEYLTALRMDRAKQILAYTDKRTYEVADEVGFSDPHYFSAAFKKATGVTPKEYREATKR